MLQIALEAINIKNTILQLQVILQMNLVDKIYLIKVDLIYNIYLYNPDSITILAQDKLNIEIPLAQ